MTVRSIKKYGYWPVLPIAFFTFFILTSDVRGYVIFNAANLSLALSAIFFSSCTRRITFYWRAIIHLVTMLYIFFTFTPFIAFGVIYPNLGNLKFILPLFILIAVMLSQFLVTCPKCNALYSLVKYSETSIFGSYAPGITDKCKKCGRDKSLPYEQSLSPTSPIRLASAR